MGKAIEWYSPRSSSGAFCLAAAAHASLYGVVILLLRWGALQIRSEPVSQPEEVAYEAYSEPPPAQPVMQPIVRAPEPKDEEEEEKDEDEKTDQQSEELQDKDSAVAGTQGAPKARPVSASSVSEAPATPFYKIKPKYPRSALVEGIEGWIELKIDVSENGDVENVRVVGGERRNLFQDEARRAVEKWKYKPFLDAGGKPVRKVDHQVRVDFKLKDAV